MEERTYEAHELDNGIDAGRSTGRRPRPRRERAAAACTRASGADVVEDRGAVRKRLAKMARDKAASDERYAAAVERNGKSAAKPAMRMSRY